MMNPKSTLRPILALAASSLVAWSSASAQTNVTWDITPGTVGAGDGSISGGTGTWDTTNGNWTSDAGANNIAWNNAANNTAIFDGTAGTFTLGGAINLKSLQASSTATSGVTYTFQGAALNFATGGSISVSLSGGGNFITRALFTSPITGAPAVTLNMGDNLETQFSPSSGTMTLGAVGGGGLIALGGSTAGNRIASKNGKTRWNGTGSWELTGLAAGYEHFVNSGNLIISTGTLRNTNRGTSLIGGTLHYNNPGAIQDARANFGSNENFDLDGGSLDQTSGAPITTSTHNPDMTWDANWTFIGSNGADSNLFLGNGRVLLTGTRQVTVTNAATTLALGGVIQHLSGSHGITKAGAGTLELRGNNTYTGATTVNAGTLSIPSGTSASTISIGASATLQLTLGSTASTTGGIDFAPGSRVRLTNAPTLPEYILFTSTGPMTGTPVIETPVAGYELFIEGRSLKFSQNADADSDDLPDWWELQYSTAVPADNTSLAPDTDLEPDGLTNLEEYLKGTHPNSPDTDADGLLDGVETNTGTWVSSSDTGTDPLDNDADGDSLLDGVETNTGIWVSATNTGTNPHLSDTDGDSYPDNAETNTGNYVSASNTGTNPNKSDTDGDTAGDWYEIAASLTDPSNAGSNPGVPYPLPDPDASTGAPDKPVKVYIMSGQSNMVGMGTVNGTDSKALSYITRTLNRFPNLIDSAGNFTARQDVYYRGVISAVGNGPLAPGFSTNASTFGPELGFGHIMGWFHDEALLLLKSSIGNRALGWDILPPGTPSWIYGSTNYAGYGIFGNWPVGGSPPTSGGWYAGKQYDMYFMHETEWAHPDTAVTNVVDVLNAWVAEYSGPTKPFAGRDFEIAGFVWWQGDRDRYDMGHATTYEQNLVTLINSLRSYYSNRYPGKVVPNAPFVLATLGQTPLNSTNPSEKAILDAMLAVDGESGEYPQFAGNVKTVYAHPLSEGGASNDHYLGRAGTYMLVGDALGRAMMSLESSATGNTFANWIAAFPSVPPGLAGFNQDADGDGVENGVENFFGTNPGVGSAGLVAGTSSGNPFILTHPQNASPATGVTAAYRWSKDLATFHEAGASDGVTTVNFNAVTNAGITTVTATVTGTAAAKLFVDVQVIQN